MIINLNSVDFCTDFFSSFLIVLFTTKSKKFKTILPSTLKFSHRTTYSTNYQKENCRIQRYFHVILWHCYESKVIFNE